MTSPLGNNIHKEFTTILDTLEKPKKGLTYFNDCKVRPAAMKATSTDTERLMKNIDVIDAFCKDAIKAYTSAKPVDVESIDQIKDDLAALSKKVDQMKQHVKAPEHIDKIIRLTQDLASYNRDLELLKPKS